MEVRYIGKNDFMTGKIYVVLSIEDDDYRIVDESGEDYPYPIDSFEIVGGSESDVEANAPIFEINPYDDEEPPGAALYKEACNLIDAARKGNVKGYQEGMKFLLDAAEIGNIGAMNCIGMLYYRGYGVKQDYTQSLKWFRKSAAYGNHCAYENIAIMYKKGHGVPCNRKIASDMYFSMAEYIEAIGKMNCNGFDIEPTFQEVIRCYSVAGELGNPCAYDKLGWCYYKGRGVKQDYKKALEYFVKAAYENDAYAALHIAICYYHGHGVKQNYEQALCWAERAARKCLGEAMNIIARIFEEGKGVTKDLGVAFVWYQRALSAGYEEAKAAVERLHDYQNAAVCPVCTSFKSEEDYLVPCPCCGEGLVEFGHVYDICEVCWWEDDPLQYQYLYYAGGANKMSLYQARKAYRKGIRFPYRHHRLVRFKQFQKARRLMGKKYHED